MDKSQPGAPDKSTQVKASPKQLLLEYLDTQFVLPQGHNEVAQPWTFGLDKQARRQILGQTSDESITKPSQVKLYGKQPAFISQASVGPQHSAFITSTFLLLGCT